MRSRLATVALRLAGWTPIGERPRAHKAVIACYPHTSNWDLLLYVLVAWALHVPLAWMGKDALFRPPIGPLMRMLGGIPVRRDRRENTVEQMRRRFAAEPGPFYLVVAAEGTRGHVPLLKSGFYHIAAAAGVPIAAGTADYARKEVGFCGEVVPSGDVHRDMERLRELWRGRTARYPECAGELRLREEAEPGSAPTSSVPVR